VGIADVIETGNDRVVIVHRETAQAVQRSGERKYFCSEVVAVGQRMAGGYTADDRADTFDVKACFCQKKVNFHDIGLKVNVIRL
jgi:hypothetical protein